MNNIQAFTFYRNYYEIIKYLPQKDKLQLYDAILEYMFEDKEPELKDLLKGIWVNLKMPLDSNKKNITNGKKGGRPRQEEETQRKPKRKPKENPNENPNENPKKTQDESKEKPKRKENNIFYFLFYISNNIYKNIYMNNNIYNKIYEWLEYKEQRKEKYTEIGLKSLLTQIDKKIDEYGEQAIIDLIDECMSNNYKGIIFDKLKNKKKEKKDFMEIIREERSKYD